MRLTEHVEYLLRQGHKPKELLKLGFSKHIVTRVRRRLREEKTASQVRTGKLEDRVESDFQSTVKPPPEMTLLQSKLESLKSKFQQLENRVEALEALGVELEDIESHINGTPALGLKRRFKCDCGSSGYVALLIKCTKCGRETWWGWHPK